MPETLLLPIIGIAIVDSLNPSLFIAQFFLLTTPQPVARILSYIAGVLVVNFGGGVLILAGARALISQFFSSLSLEAMAGLQLALGIGMVVFGLWLKTGGQVEAKKPRSLRPIHTFALGMVVMLNEITTALPYFAAIERIAEARMATAGNLLALGVYNLVFSGPLLVFLGLFIVFRQRFAARIDSISRGVQLWSVRLIKWLSLIVGVGLALNGTAYLLAGVSLFG
jgi:cytochrome c biogenesis protein CcdA